MILQRTDYRSDGVFGILYDEEGDQIAVTLEHAYHGKVPKLPAGDYHCIKGPHSLPSDPEHFFETFEVMGVPGHTGILFHIGNWHEDSDGCILLGRAVSGSPRGQMVTESRKTFERFMLDRELVPSFALLVEDTVS